VANCRAFFAVKIANGHGRAHRRLAGINVTSGTDCDQQVLAIGSDGRLRVECPPPGKVRSFFRFAQALGRFRVVLEANHAGHIADINVVPVKDDSERTPHVT